MRDQGGVSRSAAITEARCGQGSSWRVGSKLAMAVLTNFRRMGALRSGINYDAIGN